MLSDSTGATGTHGVRSTLLAWHKAHPPTDYERNRNNLIYSGVSISGITRGQGNRNPFIDFPQFVDGIYLNTATQSFNKWQLQRFTFAQLQNTTLTGPTGDLDGDGRSNYAEFLLGGNPNAGSDEPLAAARTGNNLTLTFRRPKGVTEQASIEVSSNLVRWDPVPGWETASVITDEGDYQRIDYTLTITLDGKFYRVVFERDNVIQGFSPQTLTLAAPLPPYSAAFSRAKALDHVLGARTLGEWPSRHWILRRRHAFITTICPTVGNGAPPNSSPRASQTPFPPRSTMTGRPRGANGSPITALNPAMTSRNPTASYSTENTPPAFMRCLMPGTARACSPNLSVPLA
jgi:hypothetical protein